MFLSSLRDQDSWSSINNNFEYSLPKNSYPKISIVTPTFQHGSYLEETLCSVLSQGYPNLEYIVIDGGSTDETIEILKRYDKELSYWISEPDRGHAHALNKGFSVSSGEILAWINAGDFYFPQSLQLVAKVFQTFPKLEWLTTTQPGRYQADTGAYTYYSYGFSSTFFKAGGYLGFEPFSLGFIQQESTFWHRTLWEKAGGRLDESLRVANDFELWRRFFDYAELALLDAPLGCFRVHDQQRSTVQQDLYRREAWSCLSMKRNNFLSLGYRLYQKSRLYKLMDWPDWLSFFYGEKALRINVSNAGQITGEWKKIL